ncbi:MAG: ABC transporter ATP-binding protein [Solirubrobacteraceae bacterium]
MSDAATVTPAVKLRDVFCVHRTHQGDAAALQGLTLTVATGERVCVLGPSGAGKTTLLRVIAGLQRPSAGVAEVFGLDVGRLSPRATARARNRWVSFPHQHAEAALCPDLTIAHGVALGLALRGVPAAQRDVRAAELLTAAGLGDRADTFPCRLSGGERQRVAVCAALAHRPRLLLADEPTAELDAAAALTVAQLIEQLADRDGTTVIIVSHDPALAQRWPRAVQIRDGRLVEDRDSAGDSLVVAAGGWVRIGRRRLAAAGIGERVRAQGAPAGAGVLLTAAGDRADDPRARRPRSPAAALHTPVTVELRAVTRTRGAGADRRTVLRELTASFAPGRLTVVVGRSGSGKTTLIELVACLATPEAGAVLLDGDAVGGPGARSGAEALAALRRARIGYLPQEPAPVGFLSATENVALALAARGRPARAATEASRAMLDEVGLAQRREQRVSRLSAGEAQRVALARALACANGLLVVDEPTSRLDEEHAQAIGRLLRRAARHGHTVICATHEAELIRHADAAVTLA